MLVASRQSEPMGFYIGFELKPTVYFSWFYGVLPNFRRAGIASQLMDAVHAWAAEQGYESIRFECHNQHRPMLHLAIARVYDIVGRRHSLGPRSRGQPGDLREVAGSIVGGKPASGHQAARRRD
jgi:GNAT superfamily N-acetyltransferase